MPAALNILRSREQKHYTKSVAPNIHLTPILTCHPLPPNAHGSQSPQCCFASSPQASLTITGKAVRCRQSFQPCREFPPQARRPIFSASCRPMHRSSLI